MFFFDLFLKGGILIFSLMIILWLVSLLMKNSSIVDIFWGFGFVLSAWLYFLLTPEGFIIRKLILVILCTIWGLRLTLHIFLRNFGKPEDFRYQKWRNESPSTWWIKSLFKVFLLQGLLMWIISVPLLAAQFSPSVHQLTALDFMAVVLWLVGFFFEAVGDAQLVRFSSNPANKGKVLSTGVWRFTRHPNYFGDATQWWAYYLLAVANGGWWSIFSPVIMTLFLINVSGVALLEKSLKVEKPEYAEYIQKTSAFIPWIPKK
jgi:steroid 5-alpha reductase family enzyme